MNSRQFVLDVRWVRRRAKRLQSFFAGVSRQQAVYSASLDWICLMGCSASPRYASLFTIENARHDKNR
jgi:hypothetical protein